MAVGDGAAVAAIAATSALDAVAVGGKQCRQLRGAAHFALDRRVLGFVEIGEQEQEHDAVQTDPHHERVRIVALAEQQLKLVREDGHELDLRQRESEIFGSG